MYLGLWRFLGAALLGAMRFIELHTARARLLLAQCGQAKDMQDSYNRLLSLTLTAHGDVDNSDSLGPCPNVKQAPISRFSARAIHRCKGRRAQTKTGIFRSASKVSVY